MTKFLNILKKIGYINIIRNNLEKYKIVKILISDIYKKRISKFRQNRYQNLFKIIKKQRSRILLEVGVFDGFTAYKMIKLAKKFHPANRIEYYGFDLFEEISKEEIIKEASKEPLPYNVVKNMLKKTGVNVNLYRGNTSDTLPVFVDKDQLRNKDFDFILIDGGHSIETIRSDWNNIKTLMKQNTIVIFDDYYRFKNKKNEAIGCNSLIRSLDPNKYEIKMLYPADIFIRENNLVKINMVKVKLR